MQQLSLLQSAMDRYSFSYKVGQGLLQIATGITKCDRIITNRPPGITKVIDLIITNYHSTHSITYTLLMKTALVDGRDE